MYHLKGRNCLRMNDPKMPYFAEEIVCGRNLCGIYFADDGFKRDFAELIFADARNLVKS